MVKMMVRVTPITTKNTPVSKKRAEPTIPMTGMGSSIHKPVINGIPYIHGAAPATNANVSPRGMRNPGWNLIILLVFYSPLAKEWITKAIDAIKPPTNPPPGR